MRVETTERDNELHVRLMDRLAFSDHGLFRRMLTDVRERAARHCVFDLSQLESIDSAGLGMLIIAHETSRKEGWSLALHAPRPQVLKLLELACFDKILTIGRQ